MTIPMPVSPVLAILFLSSLVSPAKAQDGDTYVNQLTHAGTHCYGLPYGGLGFVSHIITYYSVISCICGFQPLTWKVMDGSRSWLKWGTWLDRLITLLQLVMTIVITIRTMCQCAAHDNAWQFTLLAVMKLILSFTSGLIPAFNEKWWFVLVMVTVYACGVVIGMVGLISLLVIFDRTMVIIVSVFCGALLVTWLAMGLYYKQHRLVPDYEELEEKGPRLRSRWGPESVRGLVAWMLLSLVVLAALCSDWIVADAMGGEWLGYSDDTDGLTQALYWIYFVGQKLVVLAGIWSVQCCVS